MNEIEEMENELGIPKEVNLAIQNQYSKMLLRLALEHVECRDKRLACRIKDYLGIGYAGSQNKQ